MPNHIQNDIVIKGPKATLERIAADMRSEDSAFDFNKVLPMPAPLADIVTGACTIDGKQCRLWREIDGKSVAIPATEVADMQAKYGATSWYDWSVANWGTKWNAYDVSEPTLTSRSLRYRFRTAWESPQPILQALADKYHVAIRVNVSGETYDGRRYHYDIVPTLDAVAA